MSSSSDKYRSVLQKYIDHHYLDYVISLMMRYPVVFRISKPRKTKLGDFRADRKGGLHQISVNGNLNPHSFLITTIHEFAHLVTYEEYGWKVKPHGKEWQSSYVNLMLPVIEKGELPKDVHEALLNSLYNVKASSCTDLNLHRTLIKYDKHADDHVYLEQVQKDELFLLNGRTFRKGNLRRTRFVCMEQTTQKTYLVNALARVKEIKE
jgi:hypothetical protein